MNWTTIWGIIKNPTVQRWLLMIALMLCIFFWFKTCSSSRADLNRAENNFNAYKDTTRKVYLKNGQIEFEKQMLIVEKGELKKYSDSLKIELDKEKSNVKVIVKYKIIYRDTTIYVDSSKYRRLNDSTYIIDWEFQNYASSVYKSIKGNSIFEIDGTPKRNLKNLVSHLNESIFCLDVVTGIREVSKNKYVTFVRTKDNNPDISFEQVEGAIVDPSLFESNEDWIILGPQVGFGYSDHFGFSVGVGVTIKLFGFHF